MKTKYRLVSLGLIVLTLILLSTSCTIFPPKFPDTSHVNTQQEMEVLLQSLVDSGEPPGLSLAVVKNNNIIYQKSFGYSDGHKKVPATNDTVYHWWSITKPFTAVAILQLQEQGKLNLNDSVKSHLPFVDIHPYKKDERQITINDLLTHSSGLPGTGAEVLSWVHFEDDKHFNQTRLIEQKIGDYSKLEYSPGEDARYSNIGYMVLAAIIEKQSGQSYEDYIRDHILRPLKMQQTDFTYTKQMTRNEAIGSHPVDFISMFAFFYLDKENAISEEVDGRYLFNRIYTNQTAPSGLIGPVTDYARFMMAILNDGKLDEARILSQESILLMKTPVIETPNTPIGDIEGAAFSPGWFYIPEEEGFSLNHGGSGAAFVTMSKLYPEKKIGIAVMANSTYLGRRMGMDAVEMASRLKW